MKFQFDVSTFVECKKTWVSFLHQRFYAARLTWRRTLTKINRESIFTLKTKLYFKSSLQFCLRFQLSTQNKKFRFLKFVVQKIKKRNFCCKTCSVFEIEVSAKNVHLLKQKFQIVIISYGVFFIWNPYCEQTVSSSAFWTERI